MKKQGQDKKKIGEIIKRAEEYLRMPKPLEVDAAFGRAVSDVMGRDVNAGVWGEYKQAARNVYLAEKEKNQEVLSEIKAKEIKRGAQQAAWARRDDVMLEAEENNDNLSELKRSRNH